jgi:hypothetical protein
MTERQDRSTKVLVNVLMNVLKPGKTVLAANK